LVVGLASLVILTALVIGLVRQLKLLAGSVAELQNEVRPILERMRADAERAQQRAEHLRGPDRPLGSRRR
jgi:hypothetical protein